ncbi:MAG: hypothetical protein ACFCGT_01405 [Sandaracinaceae bacterium]
MIRAVRPPLLSPLPLLGLLAVVAACGPGIDREGTLQRLRAAIDTPIEDEDDLHRHNALTRDVVDHGLLEGMTKRQLEEAIGEGRFCGANTMCSDHDFGPNDLIYDIGRSGGFRSGPILIVGFDRYGRVASSYYLTRE